jgi:hypothetical protein
VDISLCLNPNSFPAASAEQAYQLFEDSWQGVLALYQSGDRYLLYLDTLSNDNLYDFSLAESFTYDDFLNLLMARGERDLYSFLTQLEDKSPALDHLDAETLDDIASYSFYMPNYPVPRHADTFSLAYFLDAILLSINTSDRWNSHQIEIKRVAADDGRYIDEELILSHIACFDHGKLLSKQYKQINDPSHLSVDELWERRDQLFPSLRFLDRTRGDFSVLKKVGLPYRQALVQCRALNEDIHRWIAMGVEQGEPKYSRDMAEGEHDQRRELTTWIDMDGISYYFDKHLYIDKFGFVGRLHFRLSVKEKKAVIAYLGRKLGI